LDDEETKVDSKGCVDGESDLGTHADIFLDLEALFIFCTQKLVDQLILTSVKLLDLPLVATGVVNFQLLPCYIVPAMSAKIQRIRRVGFNFDDLASDGWARTVFREYKVILNSVMIRSRRSFDSADWSRRGGYLFDSDITLTHVSWKR
jgi:hypothetical protein